jgi:hypothetical protein
MNADTHKASSTSQQELKYIQTLHKKELRHQLVKRLKLWGVILAGASYIAYDKKFVTKKDIDKLCVSSKHIIANFFFPKNAVPAENNSFQPDTILSLSPATQSQQEESIQTATKNVSNLNKDTKAKQAQ